MYLNKRQKELIKTAINDYEFMKVEIEQFLNRGGTFEELENFLLRFCGVVITNKEQYDNPINYIDFQYHKVDMSISNNKTNNSTIIYKTYKIYDDFTQRFIVEDWLTTSDYEIMINAPKEDILTNMVIDLKCYDADGNKEEYDKTLEDIIVFLKEEY